MNDIIQFAKNEIISYGLSIHDDTPHAVLKILQILSKVPKNELQIVLSWVMRLIYHKPITPLTSDPSEWRGEEKDGRAYWLNKRDPFVISLDGGQSWQSLKSFKEESEKNNEESNS